jgi:hypothetical protein
MDNLITLTGTVTQGRGHARKNIARNARSIREALGAPVIEGSLNIVLARPTLFSNQTAKRIRFDQGSPRLDWPAKLNGIDVWINRWESAPLHVIELLSSVHLRETLQLSDGDRVQIEVREQDVTPIPTVGRLTWLLFWSGRKRWSYTNDLYTESVQRWCRRFGATQLGTEKHTVDLAKALVKGALGTISGRRP